MQERVGNEKPVQYTKGQPEEEDINREQQRPGTERGQRRGDVGHSTLASSYRMNKFRGLMPAWGVELIELYFTLKIF
jgi:hypothetical protein